MALVACGSATNDKTNNNPGNPPGPTAGNGAGPSGTGGGAPVAGNGSGGSGGDTPPPAGLCKPGIPVTTQIPMMLNRQYQNVVHDLLGVTDVGGMPVSDLLVGDANQMTDAAWKVYQDVGAKIAAQVMAGSNKSKFITCQPSAADCLKTTIQTFGKKAFRRALTDEEVASFMTLNSATPAGTPDQVAEAILNAFLVSPSFLLIPELSDTPEGTADSPDAVKLSPQEVATRLSFLLWGSIPDDALNAAADANQLNDKGQILTQATRMIQDRTRTGGFISTFHDDWAQMNNSSAHWFKGKHDVAKYPDYTDASQVANRKELDAFFEEVAYSGGSFKELLTSNIAFVNKDNAVYYGEDPSKYGADLTKITLSSTTNPRPGFLTRAGFLSSYADYGTTSPILRGSYIAIWLLSIPVPAPDPSFAMTAPPKGDFKTQREYIEALTEVNQPCKSCHENFNPFGFVMENYDGVGKWQSKDPIGGDLNTKVTVSLGKDLPAKDFSSPVDLMNAIADAPNAKELYAQAWVAFATGRSPNGNDQCTVDALKTKLIAGNYPILSLLGDLTQTDAFRLRVRGAL